MTLPQRLVGDDDHDDGGGGDDDHDDGGGGDDHDHGGGGDEVCDNSNDRLMLNM